MFTANNTFLTPTIDTMNECLLVCVRTPCSASIRMMATSAVDAPVAIFLVYSSCPGVSATIYFLLSVEKNLYATSIVIPCSLSAARPSTNNAKSISFPWVPIFLESLFNSDNWSSKSICDSYSIRPISVDLPSSTDPQVMKRSRLFSSCDFR